MTERLHFHFSLSCIGEGNGNPLQCSCLENPRDGAAWWAAVYGVAQSRTRLNLLSSNNSGHKIGKGQFSFQSQRKAMPKNIQTTAQLNSSHMQWHPTPVLLPGKPHGRRSFVGCSPWGRSESDTSFSLFTFMHWRRKWQSTPMFLPGESQGKGSLVGCCLWGRTESDMTEAT